MFYLGLCCVVHQRGDASGDWWGQDWVCLFFFFFWNEAKDLPIPLIKEEEKKSLGYKGAELLNTKDYSCGIKALKCFAPAIPQRAALLLMEEIIKAGMEACLFNFYIKCIPILQRVCCDPPCPLLWEMRFQRDYKLQGLVFEPSKLTDTQFIMVC
jgi:hypothetical protein